MSFREHGTRVNVKDLFGNMPVRVKHRALDLKDLRQEERYLEALKEHIVGMILALETPVSVKVVTASGARVLQIRANESPISKTVGISKSSATFNIQTVRSVLSQAKYIDPSDWHTWIHTSARSSSVSVEGAISLQAAPSKRTQFTALGIKYLSRSSNDNILYDEVNSLFAASNFGADDEQLDVALPVAKPANRNRGKDRFTQKQLKGSGKGIDRWPMFVLRILINDKASTKHGDLQNHYHKKHIMSSIVKVLKALIIKFLEDNHFRAHRSKNSTCLANMATVHDSAIEASSSTSSLARSLKGSQAPLVSGLATATSTAKSQGSLITKGRLGSSRSSKGKLLGYTQIPRFQGIADKNHSGCFDTWSRIKTGNRDGLSGLIGRQSAPQNVYTDSLVQKTSRDTLGEISKKLSSHSDSHAQNSLNNSLDMRSSCNTQSADEDVVTQFPTQNEALEQSCPDLTAASSNDNAIPWENPVSKVSVLVNARTGLIVSRPSKSIVGRPCLQSSTSKTMSRSLDFREGRWFSPAADQSPEAPRSWAMDLLKGWENPTFHRTEEEIPQVSFDGFSMDAADILHGKHHRCSHTDIARAFTESSLSTSTRLSKHCLAAAHVIAQVDSKFILVRVEEEGLGPTQADRGEILALIDQHAADERVRVEQLFTEMCTPLLPDDQGHNYTSGHGGLKSRILTTTLVRPITFEVSSGEQQLFASHASHFASWGILYHSDPSNLSPAPGASQRYKIAVKTLPEPIAERCRNDPKALIELLRGEIWKREGLPPKKTSDDFEKGTESWLSRISGCPQGIIDMLISRSCRSAIMFNDELSLEQCRNLVQKLARCAFPFQCAHGRPSIIPLVDLTANSAAFCGGAEHTAFGTRRANVASADGEIDFAKAWKKVSARKD